MVAVVIGLQLALPDSLSSQYAYVWCGVEAALLVVVTGLNPRRISAHDQVTRRASLALVVVMSVANLSNVILLVRQLLGGGVDNATALLLSGGSIWITNVVVYALWYWEFDRGGPGARAEAKYHVPDFMFPQMSDPDLSAPHWAPSFFDYLYMSFTNSSAFSPTDVLPLTRWAKALMMAQSATSLTVVALVIARAVNILR